MISAAAVIGLGVGLVSALPSTASASVASPADTSSADAAAATSRSVPVVQDGYVNEAHPTAPTGANTYVRTDNDVATKQIERAYLNFSVSGVPVGATNVTATLTATAQTTSANSVEAHTAKPGTWKPTTLTWSNQPGYATGKLSSVVPVKGHAANWNVTGALPAGGNGAVLLALVEPGSAKAGAIDFAGKGGSPAPTLTVSWTCGLDSLLAPTCKDEALFGAAADTDAANPHGAGAKGDLAPDMQYAESSARYNRTFPIWHSYDSPTDAPPLDRNDPTGATERQQALSGTATPLVSWSPSDDWSKATGSDAAVDQEIQNAAANIAAVAPHKIMLSLAHEPSNKVGAGAPAGCPVHSGNPIGNTPDNYKAMWAYIEKVFAKAKATNVVWTLTYDDFSTYTCMQNALYPGDKLIDWVSFDTYEHYTPATATKPASGKTWEASLGNPADPNSGGWYNWLTINSNKEHNYLSHPWGVFEFGEFDSSGNQQGAYEDYADMKTDLDKGMYPKLKAYVVFDENPKTTDKKTGVTTTTYIRTDEATGGAADPTEQKDFDLFANDPLLKPSIKN